MTSAIMALNAGSSSVKFALFERVDKGRSPHGSLHGSLTGTDGDTPRFLVKTIDGETAADEQWQGGSLEASMSRLLEWIERHLGDRRLDAVGHRVVHGGREYSAPVRIDPTVLEKLDRLTPLAPLHQPASLAPIRHLAAFRPHLAQFACFDTAFHHGIEPPASRYALPRSLEVGGIRRYGFHGLSYEAIAAKLASMDGKATQERIIVAHLGNGASLCAMHGLRSVDTTMGFTALDGLMMGTRPGSLDPGILLYLMQAEGYDARKIEHLLYHESGLLGVSGISSDVQTLTASDAPAAAEALDLFAFMVARHTAALASTLGGIDRFVFTGGIGEHAWQVRSNIARRLGWLGADMAEDANRGNALDVASPESRIRLQVVATDEEGTIARHVNNLLAAD